MTEKILVADAARTPRVEFATSEEWNAATEKTNEEHDHLLRKLAE